MDDYRKIHGFTLIELLVVIAIIALLMSIMIPSLTKAKDQARFMICKSNLHQYGLAMTGYLTDNNEFPHPQYWLYLNRIDVPWPVGCNWHITEYKPDGLLWPYFSNEKAHLCPSWYPLAKKQCFNPSHDPQYPIEPRYNYGMNGYLGFTGSPFPWTKEITSTLRFGGVIKPFEVKSPSETIVFYEENPFDVPGMHVAMWAFDNCTFPRLPSGAPPYEKESYPRANQIASVATYHKAPRTDLTQGVGNVSMMDGSVRTIDIWERDGDITFDLSWPK